MLTHPHRGSRVTKRWEGVGWGEKFTFRVDDGEDKQALLDLVERAGLDFGQLPRPWTGRRAPRSRSRPCGR